MFDLGNLLGASGDCVFGDALDPVAYFDGGNEAPAALELDGHLAGRRVAVDRIARESFQDDSVEFRGDALRQLARRPHLTVQNLTEQVPRVVRIEQAFSGEHLP